METPTHDQQYMLQLPLMAAAMDPDRAYGLVSHGWRSGCRGCPSGQAYHMCILQALCQHQAVRTPKWHFLPPNQSLRCADGPSPRTCVTSVAESSQRLPKWARGLEALQTPQLQALAQQWQQQQAHLSSVHLHPHEVRPLITNT